MNEPQPLTSDEKTTNEPTSDNLAGKPEYVAHYRAVLHRALARAERLSTLIVEKAERTGKAEIIATADNQAALPPATSRAEKPATTLPELAEAYDRIDRAMRRAVLLALKLEQLAAAPKAQAPCATPTPEQAAEAAAKRAAARKQILRDVEDAIMRGAREPGDADQLQAELGDRLDSLDLEDEIGNRPIPDIIADICRDLGLGAQSGFRKWKRRTPQDIEILAARAAAPPKDTLSLGAEAAKRTKGWGEGIAARTATPPPDPGGTTRP